MTSWSLALGGVLAVGASLLSVSFADIVPTAPGGALSDPNCTLTVPAAPLTARGLATPYTLTATDPANGPCHESNAGQAAFVQATVLDPASGAIAVYDPLVIDKGSEPAAGTVLPALPERAVVGIWVSFNGAALRLNGQTAAGSCVGRSAEQPFSQFASCNGSAFFAAATAAEHAGKLTVPPLGTARDGRPCPTTRDMGLVDQDRAGNVTTEYLTAAHGRTAQKTAVNTGRLLHGAVIHGGVAPLNGSDNVLLDTFQDPALGCTPWMAPDLADPGSKATALALDELQAANFQASPIALVPIGGPPGTRTGQQDPGQAMGYHADGTLPRDSAAAHRDLTAYCTDRATFGAQRLNLDRPFTAGAASPQAGRSLFDFLTQRLAASLVGLGCPPTGPTPGPTAKPTVDPTAEPTAVPSTTATPSGSAMPTSTPRPTAAPTPTMAPTTAPSPATSPSPTITAYGSHW
ncbi:hypothetical protein [Kitasatospora sp. MAA4]|uniref:hypothetical protein n=1 Tax=Kitasatospora sp. MAA4 TaxID=3035093 RepID=UPI0024748F3C|nr:hypothetical protein [Kitasatospora sp. MAA4]